jgi:hydroxymethylpyrimidine pyrophosphatase-like HAD family hydrolase
MIIAIDFNGTICAGKYPDMEYPKDHVVETMRKFKNEGHYIIITTCVEGKPLDEIKTWLDNHKIPFHAINENHPVMKKRFKDCRKIYADVYIDDRNIGDIPSWDKIYQIIKAKMDEFNDMNKFIRK